MNKHSDIDFIISYLNRLYPSAHCELDYFSDYSLLIAVVLSAQTTDKSVNKVSKILFQKYPTLKELKDAPLSDIENCIHSIGLYKNKAQHIKDIANSLYLHGPIKEDDEEYLLSLPGVGQKTKNVVMAELFNKPYLAVDTHVARVSKRLNLASKNDAPNIIEKKLEKLIKEDERVKMHHALIFFGRYFCTSKKPMCHKCELVNMCHESKNYLK